MQKIRVAPSLLSADFAKLGDEMQALEKAGADLLHLDVMDAHFVPNLTFGPPVIKALRKHTTLPFDVHLMMAHPARYIDDFVAAGADRLSVHPETGEDYLEALKVIKNHNIQAGLALNPATPLDVLEPVWALLDFVLVMSVNPGFGGAQFMPTVLPKIKALRHKIHEKGRAISIAVDGGINAETAAEAVHSGADTLVVGTYVFEKGASYYAPRIEQLRDAVAPKL